LKDSQKKVDTVYERVYSQKLSYQDTLVHIVDKQNAFDSEIVMSHGPDKDSCFDRSNKRGPMQLGVVGSQTVLLSYKDDMTDMTDQSQKMLIKALKASKRKGIGS